MVKFEDDGNISRKGRGRVDLSKEFSYTAKKKRIGKNPKKYINFFEENQKCLQKGKY